MTVRTDEHRCSHEDCGASLVACPNRANHDVCNCFVQDAGTREPPLCASCGLTTVIPDLSLPEGVAPWARLEAAKRRFLYELDVVGYPNDPLMMDPPLAFRFLADTPEEKIYTGHADGVITINLAEANPVAREEARQQFGEPQRTLIGHLRHEFGHFVWMREISDSELLDEFIAAFGDHLQPEYSTAMQAYYDQGPPVDWQATYISRYASSHPWEDFAETFGYYMDMRAILDTLDFHLPQLAAPNHKFKDMLGAYQRAGITLNEVNRTMGLTDLVPEVVATPVIAKLEFVHRTMQRAVKLKNDAAPRPVPAK